jgi:hypothetical protein
VADKKHSSEKSSGHNTESGKDIKEIKEMMLPWWSRDTQEARQSRRVTDFRYYVTEGVGRGVRSLTFSKNLRHGVPTKKAMPGASLLSYPSLRCSRTAGNSLGLASWSRRSQLSPCSWYLALRVQQAHPCAVVQLALMELIWMHSD